MIRARKWLFIGVLAAAACSSSKRADPGQTGSAAGSAAGSSSGAGSAAALPADDRFDRDSLGALTFEVDSGTPEARARFTRGLLALHSFWYDEAVRQFDAAIAADPKMSMAYWGAAMSRCHLLWGDDNISEARQLLQRMPNRSKLPPKQAAWVKATIQLLREGDVRTSRTRFLAAMEQLHAQYPDDESATFLALALLSATPPSDPNNLAARERAAELARGVFAHNPKHPGAAHYLIHAYDTPELAAKALPEALAYAKFAPAAFHAQHMPAHIFNRLGRWPEGIASNEAAWAASVDAAKREHLSVDHHDFHSLNWLVEMNLEVGHRKAADAALATFSAAAREGLGHQNRTLYARQVASYMARTGEWQRADELLAPLAQPAVGDAAAGDTRGKPASPARPPAHCDPAAPVSNEGLIEQMFTVDARARAAAARHDVATTTKLIAEMQGIQAKLRPFMQQTQPAAVVEEIEKSHERHQEALRAEARGDDRALLKVLREAAPSSDQEVGGEMNPTGFLVHEQIAGVLLRTGDAKGAAAEYQLVLDKHPNRASALLGLARALAKAGDAAGAKARYQALAEIWKTAEEGTPGLAEVRAAVAAK